MASILHVAVGLAAGRLHAGRPRLLPALAFSALSMLPDADVIMFKFGYAYRHPLGHRGASHSIAFAAACGLVALGLTRGAWRTAGLVALVVLSHPLLDALTDGGLGVGLLWPLSDTRYFAPWRPLPVAPIGWGFLSMSGLRVALAELLPSLPLVLYALWPSTRR
jgi:inner membrane protein